MEKSKVYFADMRVRTGDNLQKKLARLMHKAGIDNIDFSDKYVAIKMHFGEPGNLSFLRPNYAKTVADVVRSLGGRPFLTDCNTLYVGGRKNALDHLDSAYENGFSMFSTGCHVIIGDGLKGTDEVLIPVEGGTYISEAKIGRAVMDADAIISLTHFKGHECSGFGGCMKNLGMGCGSRGGKMEMHSAGKPFVNQQLCIGCHACEKVCAHNAAVVSGKLADIDRDKCTGCGRCIGVCPKDAVCAPSDESNDILNCKIAEYTKAVISNRPHFHVSLVVDVSPYCDCHPENDAPIVPNIGMFASFDPVAIDLACADAVNAQLPAKGSMLEDCCKEADHHDHFSTISPSTNWRSIITHSVKIGLGSDEYELIEVK